MEHSSGWKLQVQPDQAEGGFSITPQLNTLAVLKIKGIFQCFCDGSPSCWLKNKVSNTRSKIKSYSYQMCRRRSQLCHITTAHSIHTACIMHTPYRHTNTCFIFIRRTKPSIQTCQCNIEDSFWACTNYNTNLWINSIVCFFSGYPWVTIAQTLFYEATIMVAQLLWFYVKFTAYRKCIFVSLNGSLWGLHFTYTGKLKKIINKK